MTKIDKIELIDEFMKMLFYGEKIDKQLILLDYLSGKVENVFNEFISDELEIDYYNGGC